MLFDDVVDGGTCSLVSVGRALLPVLAGQECPAYGRSVLKAEVLDPLKDMFTCLCTMGVLDRPGRTGVSGLLEIRTPGKVFQPLVIAVGGPSRWPASANILVGQARLDPLVDRHIVRFAVTVQCNQAIELGLEFGDGFCMYRIIDMVRKEPSV